MRVFNVAAILTVMFPLGAEACDIAYASCRHNDSRTDTHRSETQKPKADKPAFGWPGLHIENIGGMNVVVANWINGGVGVIVAYDKNGHLKVRDRTGRIFVLTDPTKRPASKPHAKMAVVRALQSAPVDSPAVAQGAEQPTASDAAGGNPPSNETDAMGTTPSEAAPGASDTAGTATSEQGTDTGSPEATASDP